MSILSKFIFDPIQAALARGATSSNSVVVSAAQAGQATYAAAAGDIAVTAALPLTANSAAALGSNLIKDAEDGLRLALDGVITAGLANVPIIGGVITPEAVGAANMALSFAEQHALTYVSSLFSHGKAQIPAAVPQS